jgi:hypothetical protein
MNKDKMKLFIVRKYVKAHSVAEALRIEKKQDAIDVTIDPTWLAEHFDESDGAHGFEVKKKYDHHNKKS